jgi:MFS transporter, AAHS family, 4-hydroxybenzoate transporter
MQEAVIKLTEVINPPKISSLQLIVSALYMATFFIDGADVQVIGSIAPGIAKEWHVSHAALGPVLSFGLIGLSIGYVGVSSMTLRLGQRPILGTFVTVFALFTILNALARSVADVMVYRLLSGVGVGGAIPCCVALNGEYTTQRRRGTAILLMYTAWTLGQTCVGVIAAWVETVGWRAVLLLCGGAALVVAVLLFLFLPESADFLARRPSRQPQMLKILRRIEPRLSREGAIRVVLRLNEKDPVSLRFLLQDEMLAGTLLIWGFYICVLLSIYCYQTWLRALLVQTGRPMATAIFAATAYTLGGLVASTLLGPLVDRLGPFRVAVALLAKCGVLFRAEQRFCLSGKLSH